MSKYLRISRYEESLRMFGVAYVHLQYKILFELEKLYFMIIIDKRRHNSTRLIVPFINKILVIPRFLRNCLYVMKGEKCRIFI